MIHARPAEAFERVLAVLAGERVPLDDGSRKVLYFMLHRRDGCDATVTPDRFWIQYGWHLSHHRYFSELAPAIASFLLAGAPAITERRATIVPAGSLPYWSPEDELGPWSQQPERWRYDAFALWVEREPACVTLRLRASPPAMPAGTPEPLEPAPVFVAGNHPCPHCGAIPERYRRLRDGALVCGACGASSSC